MNDINKVFSNNLIKYRTLMGLKQSELAKMINYSDKSISKWERGDGLPDLKATIKLCDIFGITVNDMLKENANHDKAISTTIAVKNKKHLLTSILSSCIVWFIATIVFVTLLIARVPGSIWLPFIYAIPISSIVLLVFSCIWGNHLTQAICVSLIVWGIVLSIALSCKTEYIWFISCIAGVFQIMIFLWFALRKLRSRKKS